MNKLRYLISIGLMAVAGSAMGAGCPAVTVANMQGVAAGAFPIHLLPLFRSRSCCATTNYPLDQDQDAIHQLYPARITCLPFPLK